MAGDYEPGLGLSLESALVPAKRPELLSVSSQ